MTTIALLITSVLIAGCGYVVTESNANILLAGYNTMSKKEKEIERSCVYFWISNL